MSQRPPLSTHPIKTLPEKIFPLLSPLGQKMVLGILFLPVLFFLATGAWLDFSLKPPVLSSLSGVTRVLYDLHSILRSLSYIKSLKESPLLSENISRIAGYREQIQATVTDIRQDTSIFTDKDMERLSLLEKSLIPHSPSAGENLSSPLRLASLMEKDCEQIRSGKMEKLHQIDLWISWTGGGLTIFFFLSLGASFLWIRDYWASHRYLALTEALNHSQNAIAFIDFKTRQFVLANEGFLILSGYSREELARMGDRDILPAGCLDPVGSFLSQDEASGGSVYQCQTECLRKDKTTIPVSVRLEESLWDGRKVLIEMVSDQSLQEALFKKNRETLSHLENMIKNLGEGLIELSSSGEMLSINTSGQTILGVEPEQIVGQKISTDNLFLNQEIQESFESSFQRVLEDEIPLENDFLVLKRNNLPPVEVSTTLTPFFKNQPKGTVTIGARESGEQSSPKGVLLLFRNVSRRKQAEKKVAESEEKYRRMVESSPDGIYILNGLTLTIEDHNSGFAKMMGVGEKDSLIGRSITDFATNSPETIRDNLKKLQMAEGRTPYETIFIRSDGRKVPLSLNGNRLPSKQEESFLITVRDITLRYQSESIQNLFLKIDQMLISGESAQKIASVVTECLLETFPFMVVWITPNPGSPLAPKLQGVSAISRDLEKTLRTLFKNNHPAIPDGDTTDLVEHEHQEESASFNELLRKNGIGTVYSEPVIAPQANLLGSIHVGISSQKDLSAPLKLMVRDVARKLSLATLQQKELSHIKLLEKAFGIADTPMFITDSHGLIEWCNPAYLELTALAFDEVIGKQHPYFGASSPADPGKDPWKTLYRGEPFVVEYEQESGQKKHFLGELRISPIFKDDEEFPSNLVCIELDITQDKKVEEELQDKAYHDPLTKLPNRSLFEAQINNRLKTAHNRKNLLALLFLDLDGFKAINDRFGHEMGDTLLKALAQRLLALLRSDDDLYRIGGDEFVILLNNAGGDHEIAAVSRRILASIHEPFHLHGKLISVGASIGIAIYPENATSEGELLRHADLAMYNAKQTGRNRFVFFRDL